MRCYNGCPDTKLQALLDERAAAKKELVRVIPGARCVYFPMGEFHQVFLNNRIISDEFLNMFDAIRDAISNERR